MNENQLYCVEISVVAHPASVYYVEAVNTSDALSKGYEQFEKDDDSDIHISHVEITHLCHAEDVLR